MHKTDPNGLLIESSCDFCAKAWDPEGTEIMIEGHKGSLLCMKCLSAAYAAVVHHGAGEDQRGKSCTMCIEERAQVQWESPVVDDKRVCLRCIKQAATALEKDPETGWKRPVGEGMGEVGGGMGEGEDDE